MYNRKKIGKERREGREGKGNRIITFAHLFPAGCVKCGVTRLVYTSTYNVVFGGQEIKNGDESLPYLPTDKVIMHLIQQLYNREKFGLCFFCLLLLLLFFLLSMSITTLVPSLLLTKLFWRLMEGS